MTAQEAWDYLDKLTRDMPHSRDQVFGHQQLVDCARGSDAAGRDAIEDALLVLAHHGTDAQRNFATGYWGVVAPSPRVFAYIVEAYVRHPINALEQVLGQVMGLPWGEPELDRVQAHFLKAPADAPGLLYNLITQRPQDARLWAAVEDMARATDDYVAIFDLYSAALAIGRGQDLLPLLAGKPKDVLQRVASGLWGEGKDRFLDALGLT